MGLNKPVIITSSAVDTSNLASKSDIDTLKNDINTTLGNFSPASIKKVQRGTATAVGSVTLSGFTDLNKMIVLINGSCENGYDSGGYSWNWDVYVSALTLSKLTTAHSEHGNKNGDRKQKYSYQVIEFY